MELGFFGDLDAGGLASMESKFSGEVGIMATRGCKYGARWDPSTEWFVGIYDPQEPTVDRIFDLTGKVVAVLKPSIELRVSMRLGVEFGWLGSLSSEQRSGMELKLDARFMYGLGPQILEALPASHLEEAFFKLGEQSCLVPHEMEVQVNVVARWLGVRGSLTFFGAYNVVDGRDLFNLRLLVACYTYGGVSGETLDYERIDDDNSASSLTYNQFAYFSYVAPAQPEPFDITQGCVPGVDCPSQPGTCSGGYTGTMIAFPCASGCANGVMDLVCKAPTCCQARNQYAPSNSMQKPAGEWVEWTSNAITVPGGMYAEIVCNAGYTLSGRNLGFQGLGMARNEYQFTMAENSGSFSRYRRDFPLDSDYTPCTNGASVRENDCKFRQAVPGDGGWKLEERTCTPISCGSYPAPAHGTVSPTASLSYGQTVTIACNAGYELSGDDRFSATPSCQANGEFTSGKICARKSCGAFPSIAKGIAFPASGAVSGQRVVISCDEGYEITQGDTSVVCDKGVYQLALSPTCTRISCPAITLRASCRACVCACVRACTRGARRSPEPRFIRASFCHPSLPSLTVLLDQVDNGMLEPTSDIFVGDAVDIICNAGYFLRSSDVNKAECTSYG